MRVQHSFVIVTTTHPFLSPHTKAKDLRRHGTIIPIGILILAWNFLILTNPISLGETRQIKLITTGLPAIKDIVGQTTAIRKHVNNTTITNPPAAKTIP